MTGPQTELREELVRLQTALARRLREKLEGTETLTPAWLEVARKLVADSRGFLEDGPPEPMLPPVARDLPFVDASDE